MPNKMLIDASHPEETRVVVTRGNRIEEFDFESRDKKQLKGNIYLARVTRVEPSLQAAFVEYGGNRHGFLAFSEIHPDYYQIPIADRQALLRADAEAAEQEEEDEEAEARNERRGSRRRRGGQQRDRGRESRAENGDSADLPTDIAASASPDAAQEAEDAEGGERDHSMDAEPGGGSAMAAAVSADVISEPVDVLDEKSSDAGALSEADSNGGGRGAVEEVPAGPVDDSEVESVGAEDALEELPSRRRQVRRQYKIQEVIKRRQILLVQVVKEERGNKGAALTTYLSLAGRYSVLMPNTARGGGISRKITSAQDRKRLKELVQDLDVPTGMGVILRTAGANRTKPEIKRDYEYLMRLWETVRTLTLQSIAPTLVYEEGSLIKRSVRDLYNKDIDEIQVAGEEGYREAKDFMRMLMPSHAKVVQPYRDVVPIFARNGIEAQLDRMLQPQVTLKSGGYIIINQTEALVSIDVNSGRSTREHSIEDTALQTNLEAAEEVARQLRLRDLAGLIVIDFIDMEEKRNNRAVEKRLKDHLKNDRARIQVGHISHFGLLEMSRQRIRASVLESTMKPCPHCGGAGHVRSDSSVALHVVRAIEEFLLKDARSHITVRTPAATALYVLNHKRRNLSELEERFGLTITIEADESLGTQHYSISRGAPVEHPVVLAVTATTQAPAPELEDEADEIEVAGEDGEAEDESEGADAAGASPERLDDGTRGRKRRRRRRRRGGRDREGALDADAAVVSSAASTADRFSDEDEAEAGEDEESEDDTAVLSESQEAERKRRRRGKRGGRRNRRDDEAPAQAEPGLVGDAESGEPMVKPAIAADALPAAAIDAGEVADQMAGVPEAEPGARKPRRPRKSKAAAAAGIELIEPPADVSTDEGDSVGQTPIAPAADGDGSGSPVRASRRKPNADDAVMSEPVVSSLGEAAAAEEAKPKKGGWWQRKGFFGA